MWKVYIADPKSETMVYDDVVPAGSKESAKIKAAAKAGSHVTENVDDYDFGVHLLVELRPKEKVQKVRVVDE